MIKIKEEYRIKTWLIVLKNAFSNLFSKDPLILGGATAFFTIFALPPIILIIVQAFGLVLQPSVIRQEIFTKLNNMFGQDTTQQIIDTLAAVRKIGESTTVIILGSLFLVFVATNLFNVIKLSLNKLWSVRPKNKTGWKRDLKSRMLSIILIIAAGLLLVVGLVGQSIQVLLGEKVAAFIPFLSFYFKGAIHYLFSILINTAWFIIVFRYLADVRPSWRSILPGAVFTSVLFNLGKIILHALLVNSNLNTLYGASASIVLLLLFVFYTSLILYLGASFVIAWNNYFGHRVPTVPYAEFYITVEKDTE